MAMDQTLGLGVWEMIKAAPVLSLLVGCLIAAAAWWLRAAIGAGEMSRLKEVIKARDERLRIAYEAAGNAQVELRKLSIELARVQDVAMGCSDCVDRIGEHAQSALIRSDNLRRYLLNVCMITMTDELRVEEDMTWSDLGLFPEKAD
jgi:hypothetical protein